MSDAWKGFRLLPDDLLFFRDGRPSTRGDDHYLRSLFPPNPSTLYGALRTRRLLDEGVSIRELRRRGREHWQRLPEDLRTELGEWGGFGHLEVRGPWLVCGEDEVLLPAPADLAVVPGPSDKGLDSPPREEPPAPRAGKVVRFLASGEIAGGQSHGGGLLEPFEWHDGFWKRWSDASPPRIVPGWWVTRAGFEAWAAGGAPAPTQLLHCSALWIDEARVGVGLEADRRMSAEGLLYTFGFVRLQRGISLGFDARATGLAAGCRVTLGGEGRTAWLRPGPALPDPPSFEGSCRRLRLSFATPAVSAFGAAPPGFPAAGETGEVFGLHARFTGGIVPGYGQVGGWDLARSRPKPLRRAIPAGSVILLEAGSSDGLSPAHLHGRALSDYEAEEHLARQGFGLILAGIEPQLHET